MTDLISKTDLLLALAELPQEASKREVLSVIYDMPTRMLYTVDDMNRQWEQDMEVRNGGDPWIWEEVTIRPSYLNQWELVKKPKRYNK